MINLITVGTREEMSSLAAEIFKKQIVGKPDTVLGLATGSTPELLYKKLGEMCKRGEVDFSRVKTVNLDEYAGLDTSNDQSYRYYMNKNLFDRVNIKKENTNLPCGTASDLDASCAEYSALLSKIGTRDIQLLGVGNNGHIGFCEPGETLPTTTSVITLTDSTINANSRFFASKDLVPKKALSMGIAEILDSKQIVMLACGKAKKAILMDALSGRITTKNPASMIQLHKNVTVIISENE